jgi:hypothetical protein
MPNWCANTVTVEHSDTAMIDKFEQAVVNGNLFETFAPIGEWDYEAAVDKWSTKWDISNGEVIDRYTPEVLCVSFETAWCQPSAFYDALVEQGFTVNAQFFEPGVAFVGQYVNGEEEVFDIDPDDLSNIPDDLNEQWGIADMFEDWDE